MGSGYNNQISKYLNLTTVNIKLFNKKINITFFIKLDKNKYNFTVNKLKEHIKWSLNEASYRSDPLKINKKNFVINKKNITNIDVLS